MFVQNGCITHEKEVIWKKTLYCRAGRDVPSSVVDTETFSRAEMRWGSTDEESSPAMSFFLTSAGDEGAVVSGVSAASSSASPSSSEVS